MSFIPANESKFLIWFFSHYTKWLLNRRFSDIEVYQDYRPTSDSKTIYFMNHNMWWDGLLPLYLNRFYFKQRPRAIMEDKQMLKHRFFSKIGAFSINLEDPKSTLKSLRYAVESMNREKASLFIYPEGEIKLISDSKPEFKQGLSWLYKNLDESIDFVPIAFYPDFSKGNKPSLFIRIGKQIQPDRNLTKEELTLIFERALHYGLQQIKLTAVS